MLVAAIFVVHVREKMFLRLVLTEVAFLSPAQDVCDVVLPLLVFDRAYLFLDHLACAFLLVCLLLVLCCMCV